MKHWIAKLGRLYPRSWRARYGPEFDALLEEVAPDWHEFGDVLKGAVHMQILRGEWRKPAAALAVLGAIAALTISFTVPKRYVSSATLKIARAQAAPQTADFLDQLTADVLSRTSLAEIIRSQDLYHDDRARVPLEDVTGQMRGDVRIEPSSESSGARALRVSFTYPDPVKARTALGELLSRMMSENLMVNSAREHLAEQIWHEPLAPAERGETLEVLAAPSLPKQGSGPNRLLFAAAGLGIGFVVGLLAAAVRRGPRRAFQVAGWAAASVAVTLAFSYLIADHYTSSATLKVTAPLSPSRWFAVAPHVSPRDHIEHLSQTILGRDNLLRIIQNPRIDLYRKDRARIAALPYAEQAAPLQALADRMRREIILDFPAPSKFTIAFTYTDRYKAQTVIRELTTGFIEEDVRVTRVAVAADPELVQMSEYKVGENLEILDPATLPEVAVSPNHAELAAGGLLAGLLLGAYRKRSRRTPDPPAALQTAHS